MIDRRTSVLLDLTTSVLLDLTTSVLLDLTTSVLLNRNYLHESGGLTCRPHSLHSPHRRSTASTGKFLPQIWLDKPLASTNIWGM